MGFTPSYLGHVNIYVRNAAAAREWYESVLGLHTYDFMEGRAAFMSADLNQSHEIALMEGVKTLTVPGPGRWASTTWRGAWAALRTCPTSTTTSRKRTCPSSGCRTIGLSLGIYIKDPDGNGIEVYYETPREEWHRQDTCS